MWYSTISAASESYATVGSRRTAHSPPKTSPDASATSLRAAAARYHPLFYPGAVSRTDNWSAGAEAKCPEFVGFFVGEDVPEAAAGAAVMLDRDRLFDSRITPPATRPIVSKVSNRP